MNKLYNIFRKKTRLGLMIIILLVSLSLATMLVSADGEDGSTEEPSDPPIDFIDIELIDWQLLEFVNFDPLDFQMRTYLTFNILLIEGPSHNSDVVYIYVNSTLWHSEGSGGDIQTKILRYKSEMEATGFSVYLWEYFSGSPEYIRSNLTAAPSDLVGCVLIGNIPSAWFQYFHDPDWGHASYSEFPIDLFYMDLDGIWQDNYDKTGWIGTWPPTFGSDGIYDYHYNDVEPDIWVGRIKGDDMNEAEVGLVKSYFDKNHDYRTGVTANPQNALVYVDDDWSPGNGIRDAVKKAFPDYNHVYDKAKTIAVNYLENLSDGYSWVHVMSHGNPGGHSFKIPGGGGGSVNSMTYKNGDYPVLFYNLFVCSGARFTSSNYLGGWCLFSGDTLGVIGSTKTGSMINDDKFYTPLSNGKILGEAFREWFDHTITHVPVGDQPWFYGMTYLGDPTLWATGHHTVTINTNGLPDSAGSHVVYYTSGGTLTTGSIVGGTWTGICDHGTSVSIVSTITPPPGDERYATSDTHSWTVNGPATHSVNYKYQYRVILSTDGLSSSNSAELEYISFGVSESYDLYDGHGFYDWCDKLTTLEVENPVVITLNQERYYSIDQTYWASVTTSIFETIKYIHQFKITCAVNTVGVEFLDGTNYVTVSYTKSESPLNHNIYDSHSFSDWMDDGSTYTFQNPSSASTGTHRWYTPETTSYSVESSVTTSLPYYEQYLKSISSSGGFLNSIFYGTVDYVQFAESLPGSYYDYPLPNPWNNVWCDQGSTLTASKIVLGPTNERYHTPVTTSWTVTNADPYTLPYHKEYKITIMAEGLPDSTSTTVTIGVANPSIPDTVSGGDISNHDVVLDSGNSFTWFNWVHADTDLTALTPIEYAPNEKYVLICWTKDLVRDDPPTVYADLKGVVYSAQYVGLKKDMSLDDADLCDSLIVTIEVSIPPTGTSDDAIDVIDDLPNEMSYVTGSAMIDGISYTPIISVETSPDLHQQLAFTVDGDGPRTITITFEVKINRAYESDTEVNNLAGATFDFEDIPTVNLDVLYPVTIHPYEGPSLSKATDGPEIVPMFTEVGWVFTYIVKNNYDYLMDDPLLKDHFGAELDYDINTVIANLLTDPDFYYSNGKTKQLRLEWTLPDITSGEAFMLQVTTHTKTNPGGIQLFSTPGEHILNSGANLKWYNDRGKKQSLTTDTISVTAVGQIYGYIKDQYDDGIEHAIVEIYYDGALITSTLTDAFGQYNCNVELTESGVYTVKIDYLPNGYGFNGEPQEKTDIYTVGQVTPTEVSFDIIKM